MMVDHITIRRASRPRKWKRTVVQAASSASARLITRETATTNSVLPT
jgi:hypothetical protein